MIDPEQLKDLLHDHQLTRKDKLLVLLAAPDLTPKSVATLKEAAARAGLRSIRSWNVSDILGRRPRAAVRSDSGWELNGAGKRRVAELVGVAALPRPTTTAAANLRPYVSQLKSSETAAFVEEAVSCLEFGQRRAAVVLSWVGAVSVLYDHVASNYLVAFNAEATRRDTKWRVAKTKDGLARMKEHDFLEILESLGVIGKNVKQELQACLSLRNACGHPNSLAVGDARVASHIEILVLNVFAKY